mgnify:CR=1 FL=1
MDDNDLEREAARKCLEESGDGYDDLTLLKQYIQRLEAERDYYMQSSKFAGVPNTPKPKEICDI